MVSLYQFNWRKAISIKNILYLCKSKKIVTDQYYEKILII